MSRRISVYLPDDLATRMDEVAADIAAAHALLPVQINWSRICQKAIEAHLDALREELKP